MESNSNIEKDLQEKLGELTPKSSLFESIHYADNESLDNFLLNMNYNQAIYCLIEATKAAYRRGSFKMEETEAISKALRIIVDN